MKKFLEILKKCSLFADVSEENLGALLGCLQAKTVFFDKKYTVMAESDPARYIGIVLSGGVQVEQTDYYGNRSILFSAEPSELFAETFACAEVSSLPVSIIAKEPSEIMLIDCRRILYTCSNGCGFHQQMIFNLMKNLATKNMAFHRKMEVTSKRSTREKLMAYLLQQAKKNGKNAFVIPFDRQELADYLEVDRSGLSAEISKLRKEGVLSCRKNQFELL